MKANNWYLTLPIATIITVIGLGAARAASEEPSSSTPQQVFDGMRQSFQADKAKGVHARYQWELSGPNGGEWWIDVNDGTYKMGKGKIDNPNVTFVTSDKDWVAISQWANLSGTWALYDRPTEGSRRSGRRQKTRRNLSLEFQLRLQS